MNPENRAFFNYEEETENKAGNKEKKEQINLSFMLASDLIKQIEADKGLYLNEYQKTCEYAVIHKKASNEYAIWDLEDNFGEGFSDFLKELPSYFKEVGDKETKILFCGSKYDIPLHKIPKDSFNQDKIAGDRIHRYITPDGVQYQMRFSEADKGTALEMRYSDEDRLSVDEVKKLGAAVKNENGKTRAFAEFDYDFEEGAKHNNETLAQD